MIGGPVADDRRNTNGNIILTYENANAAGQDKRMPEVSYSLSKEVKLG
jgi:hypothetical protein